jgi:hypothetical protein
MSAVACRPVTPRLWSGFLVVGALNGACCPSRKVCKVLRCPNKRGNSSSCCSPCAFSACCVGEVSTQYLVLIIEKGFVWLYVSWWEGFPGRLRSFLFLTYGGEIVSLFFPLINARCVTTTSAAFSFLFFSCLSVS